MVSRQLQVLCRTGKGRRPKNDVLPLCHETNCNAMQCNNNNCSISTLLEWFPCLYRRTEQGSRNGKQQTPLRRRCGIARLTMCLLNVSPVNAKLTSLFYVHQYILHFFGDVVCCRSNTITTTKVVLYSSSH